MVEPLSFIDSRGNRIAAALSVPAGGAKGIVILCHGFLSTKSSNTNQTLTRLLGEQNLATFCFDFFGQGESEGRFEDVTVSLAVGQAIAAFDYVKGKGYARIGLVGSSFGGLVGLLTAAQRPEIACLALKCPVVDFGEELGLEFGADELEQWKRTDTIPDLEGGPTRIRLKYALYEDSLKHIAYGPARAITAPTLIVQGEQDELVPLHQCRRLLMALPGPKQLVLLPQADHRFTRPEDFHAMVTSIADWFATYFCTTPS
jgi:pimeloyl-ACP methyl ester carboxylesterase